MHGFDYTNLYKYGFLKNSAFFFKIPDEYRNCGTYYIDVRLTGDTGAEYIAGDSFTFQSRDNAKTTYAYNSPQDADCLKPDSRCVSTSNDYNTAAFPEVMGWNDGKNYFNEWGCTSTAGINYIARLNVLPLGSHGNRFQKDSFYMNGVENMDGGPIVYFTATRNDSGSVFSLKKTAYNGSKWAIYDVLDTKSAGGVSSQDGVYPNYIMNDYAIPGWGPSSPLPPGKTKIPGVSPISENLEGTSYPLLGYGPRGLTNIRNYLQTPVADSSSHGPEGRTCIHMNPKLFDYDANGVPRRMIAYLFRQDKNDQHNVSKPCLLPDGLPLQKAAYYRYDYDPVKGWQLNVTPAQDIPNGAIKLASGTRSTFLSGNWQGKITAQTLEIPNVNPKSAESVLLDCSASDPDKTDADYTGARFGEASGAMNQFVFAANPPGDLYPHMADPQQVVANQANLSAASVTEVSLNQRKEEDKEIFKVDRVGGAYPLNLAGWALVTDASDETNYVYGYIESYDKATGTMVMKVYKSSGTGVRNNWKIYVSDVFVGDLYYAFRSGN